MTMKILDRIIRDARWPAEDQAELADYARVIEARRTGIYNVGDDERAVNAEGLAEANQGVSPMLMIWRFYPSAFANEDPLYQAGLFRPSTNPELSSSTFAQRRCKRPEPN